MFQLFWIVQKTKVDDLDVAKLKTVPIDFKKLSDIMKNEVNTLETKVNKLNKKNSDGTTLILNNQYNTKFREKNWRYKNTRR